MENHSQNGSHAVERMTAKSLFNSDAVKHKFQELLGKRATSFITSVLQIVASNDLLAKAEPNSVYHSAAVAATLDLPLNNSLGFAYIVPYNQNVNVNGTWQKKTVAQFQLGYKGFKQLALRSGQFLTIHATDVREGEIKKHDRLTGEMEFEWIENDTEREKAKVVGYVSFFKLINGFSQTFYMSVDKLTSHGKKYSQTFQKDKGLWKDDFHSMCLKTVTKLNLSKNAPLSVEMQKAVVVDQSIINDSDTMDVTYVDNQDAEPVDKLQERISLLIDDAKSVDDLRKIESDVPDALLDKYTVRKDELEAAAKKLNS
jgi:recombination protein RecT